MRARPDRAVVILQAREPARTMTAIGDKGTNRWHLQIGDRWVIQYDVYINDRDWGRMFVRMCYATVTEQFHQLLPGAFIVPLVHLPEQPSTASSQHHRSSRACRSPRQSQRPRLESSPCRT